MKKDEQIEFYNLKYSEKIKPKAKQNTNVNSRKNISNKKSKKKKKTNEKTIKFIKNLILLVIFVGGIIAILLSPLFKIETIIIENNYNIEMATIIELSKINIDDNIFKINKSKTIREIKNNAYIDSVKIKRKLPNTIIVHVEERNTTFQIATENELFAYINNQGYILEISEKKLMFPTIIGITENVEVGKRLTSEDLKKMEGILKIEKAATSKGIYELITGIDIAERNNYTLVLEDEDKTVYLGEASNLDTKMSYIKDFINREKGKKGEIFVNVDLNKSKPPFFREEVPGE